MVIGLQRLHAMIGHDRPAPTPSIAAGCAGTWPAFMRRPKSKGFFLKRYLPATARGGETACPGAVKPVLLV